MIKRLLSLLVFLGMFSAFFFPFSENKLVNSKLEAAPAKAKAGAKKSGAGAKKNSGKKPGASKKPGSGKKPGAAKKNKQKGSKAGAKKKSKPKNPNASKSKGKNGKNAKSKKKKSAFNKGKKNTNKTAVGMNKARRKNSVRNNSFRKNVYQKNVTKRYYRNYYLRRHGRSYYGYYYGVRPYTYRYGNIYKIRKGGGASRKTYVDNRKLNYAPKVVMPRGSTKNAANGKRRVASQEQNNRDFVLNKPGPLVDEKIGNKLLVGKWELVAGNIENIELKMNGRVFRADQEVGEWQPGDGDKLYLKISKGAAEGTFILRKSDDVTLTYSGEWTGKDDKTKNVEMRFVR